MQDVQEAQFEEITDAAVVYHEQCLPESEMTDFTSDGRTDKGTEVESLPDIDFASMMTDELREIMQETSEIMEIMKTAKTKTKKDFYKKKIHKLQKKARVILYSQYLNGKKFPQESSQISVE